MSVMDYRAMRPDEREHKLPRWAANLIDDLRRKLRDEYTRAEDARLETRPAESDAILNPYDDRPIGLGVEARVRFKMGDQDRAEYIDVYRDLYSRELVIHGGDMIAVQPRSGNSIHIAMR